MTESLKSHWLEEERAAHIHGWDFSHIAGLFYEDTDFPWDYRSCIAQYLKSHHTILDIDTGGGEFLLSLGHPHRQTAATENYEPNIALCRQTLLPLGIDFRHADAEAALPFSDNSFDLILNRHGSFNVGELYRTLKPGGFFITQQVGAENDRELVDLLLPGSPIPYPRQYAQLIADDFRRAGFCILRQEEAFRPMRFFDVGALVWFARIIQWEFPGFSVESCFDRLVRAQELLDKTGSLDAVTHRILLIAQKPTV